MDNDIVAVATQLFCTLNTPRALSCLILLRHREWDQLATKAVSPLDYLDTVSGCLSYYLDNQASAFLRKSPLLETSWDRDKVALETFNACEQQCCETNYLLQLYDYLPSGENPMVDRLLPILERARKIAGKILGPLPDSVELGFGPGTCFELREDVYTTLADKVWTVPTTTPACRSVFDNLYAGTFWHLSRQELGLPYLGESRGNRFTTVPKDAKTNRGICIEPLGNLAVQLGIGRFLKRRLSQVGLRVDRTAVVDPTKWVVAPLDGQQIHRRLARDGSRDKSWATIDLSNASDTIARELVRRVLPADWYSLLDACRSPFTLLKNKWVKLEKFSSMGNGFTFELETLLFAAIIGASCKVQVGVDLFVYGDDIVLPNDKFSEASAVLAACGFIVNLRKSYCTGPFRESCGGDYFEGFDVRPYFCKGSMSSPLEWISMHNGLRRRVPYRNHLLLERCVSPIPRALRVRGPSRLGDVVLHKSYYSVFRHPNRAGDGIHWIRGVVAIPHRVPIERWGSGLVYLLAVLGFPSDGIAIRGEPVGWRLVWMSAS
jgi:hypothetical protein